MRNFLIALIFTATYNCIAAGVVSVKTPACYKVGIYSLKDQVLIHSVKCKRVTEDVFDPECSIKAFTTNDYYDFVDLYLSAHLSEISGPEKCGRAIRYSHGKFCKNSQNPKCETARKAIFTKTKSKK